LEDEINPTTIGLWLSRGAYTTVEGCREEVFFRPIQEGSLNRLRVVVFTFHKAITDLFDVVGLQVMS